MPRVEKDAEVTLAVLTYRSPAWLSWCMDWNDRAINEAKYRWHVVACDPTPEVRADPRVSLIYDNDNPEEFYINRVYRAWNEAVLSAPTQRVILLNSDMVGFHHWIDALLRAKAIYLPTVPTSLLIESGRVPSGMPEYVRNHGLNPDEFDHEAFYQHAAQISSKDRVPGRLFMPILLDRQEFMQVGKYPEGNPPGTTGDKDLIRRYSEAGFQHVTAKGSVVYHAVMGEQNWP